MINYLEKFKLLDCEITRDLSTKVCTNISFSSYTRYMQYCIGKDLKNSIKILYEIYDRGYSVMDILDNYFLFLKATDLISEDIKYKIIPIICKYITIFHTIHEDEVELALFTNNLIQIFS